MDNMAIFPAPPRALISRDEGHDTPPGESGRPATAAPEPTNPNGTGRDPVGMQVAMHYLQRRRERTARLARASAVTPGTAANDTSNVIPLR